MDNTQSFRTQPVYRAALRRHLSTHGQRFLRFAAVGGTGVVVNTILVFIFVEKLHVNHLVAAAVASEITVITNFLLNDCWTFGDVQRRSRWVSRAARYNIVALGGMAVSLAVLAVLSDVLGLYYLLANVVAIGAGVIWNYVLNSLFTWATPAITISE